MRLFLVPFVIGCFVHIGYGQSNQMDSTMFHVINILGAHLLEQPALDAKPIILVPVGEKVKAMETINQVHYKQIGTAFHLEGYFIKTTFKTCIGFLFSSHLTKRSPHIFINHNGLPTPNLMGKEISQSDETSYATYDDIDYPIDNKTIRFENCTYQHTSFDGCFDHLYSFKSLSFSEVYHQLVALYTENNSSGIKIPRFTGKIDNHYHFEVDGATQELTLVDNKDGTFTISSYSCT